MQELGILKLFAENREEHDRYNTFFRQIQNLDRNIKTLSKLIDEYYKKYPDHNYIAVDELKSFYDYCHAQNKDRAFHLSLIERMSNLDVSRDIMEDLVEQSMEKYWSGVIVASLMPVMEGQQHGVLPEMQHYIDSFVRSMKHPPKARNDIQPFEYDIAEVIGSKVEMEGAEWHIPQVTTALGPLTKGSFGLIFAYVDGGKTSFSLAALRSFADYYKETDQKLVYACNEEAAKRVSERLTQAFHGKSYWEIHEQYSNDWSAAQDAILEMGMKNIEIIDSVTHMDQIHRILDEYGPEILFIDQGTKVLTDYRAEGVKATRLLYNHYRDLGVEYDTAVVAVEQAIGAAANKQWLELSDVYESRVAIQGELDYALGIGQIIEQPGREKFRYINVCKNKLKDGVKPRITVFFDNERCVWRPI
jgi:hypothetical protein